MLQIVLQPIWTGHLTCSDLLQRLRGFLHKRGKRRVENSVKELQRSSPVERVSRKSLCVQHSSLKAFETAHYHLEFLLNHTELV